MTTGQAIDGRPMAEELLSQLREDIALLAESGSAPGLAVLLVGDDYAARAYERRLRSIAKDVGCRSAGSANAPRSRASMVSRSFFG